MCSHELEYNKISDTIIELLCEVHCMDSFPYLVAKVEGHENKVQNTVCNHESTAH